LLAGLTHLRLGVLDLRKNPINHLLYPDYDPEPDSSAFDPRWAASDREFAERLTKDVFDRRQVYRLSVISLLRDTLYRFDGLKVSPGEREAAKEFPPPAFSEGGGGDSDSGSQVFGDDSEALRETTENRQAPHTSSLSFPSQQEPQDLDARPRTHQPTSSFPTGSQRPLASAPPPNSSAFDPTPSSASFSSFPTQTPPLLGFSQSLFSPFSAAQLSSYPPQPQNLTSASTRPFAPPTRQKRPKRRTFKIEDEDVRPEDDAIQPEDDAVRPEDDFLQTPAPPTATPSSKRSPAGASLPRANSSRSSLAGNQPPEGGTSHRLEPADKEFREVEEIIRSKSSSARNYTCTKVFKVHHPEAERAFERYQEAEEYPVFLGKDQGAIGALLDRGSLHTGKPKMLLMSDSLLLPMINFLGGAPPDKRALFSVVLMRVKPGNPLEGGFMDFKKASKETLPSHYKSVIFPNEVIENFVDEPVKLMTVFNERRCLPVFVCEVEVELS